MKKIVLAISLMIWGAQVFGAELPKDLKWLTNDSDPVYASPDAKKGGTYNTFMMSFPVTLRVVGPDANSGFRSYIMDNQLSMVGIHPNTGNLIPLIATHWAYGADKKTMYFKINPKAKWSDDHPVTADDFVFAFEFMRSKNIVDPWCNEFYTKRVANIYKIDDLTVAFEAVKAEPDLAFLYGDLQPVPKHYYKKIDADWVKKYNWEIQPNVGPYQIDQVKKGKLITFKRKKNWWGENERFFKNRFNIDEFVLKVVRDLNVAYEHFQKGNVEAFPVTFPDYWYDKSKISEVEKGYIEKLWFYTGGPQQAVGLWLNEDTPLLKDINVRLGLQYSMNIDKMLKTVLRGDYERLDQHWVGYGEYTNKAVKAREFDLKKADEYFKKAGFVERGKDGIRVKDGKRLAFTVTYSLDAHSPRLVFLKEEAKAAGVELNLELLDGSAAYRKIQEKKHEIDWGGFGVGSSVRPAAWEHYHSENAHKPQTNNLTNTDDKELDKLIMIYQDSLDPKERIKTIHKIQQMVHDRGSYIPTYKVAYFRVAYWRWWGFPAVAATRLSESGFDPFNAGWGGLFWFDEAKKAETLKAKKDGKTFPPVTKIDKTFKDT